MNMGTRTLGRTGLEVGVIGLGTEHLSANRENMDAVLDLAVEAGVNYIDLVYNDPLDVHADYWEAIAPAIRRHRECLILTLHWGFVYHEPVDHCQQCFDKALNRLGNDYTEIAMLTMVDSESLWTGWAQESIERLHKYQRDGRAGFIGLSNHKVDVARMAVVFMLPSRSKHQSASNSRSALSAVHLMSTS